MTSQQSSSLAEAAAAAAPAGEPAEFDVVVVGGGPAGSTVASFVAMRGHSVLLLERETFPRHQIGESLLPATVHGICKMLGVSEELAAANFTRKQGGTFRWGTNPQPWMFTFAVSPRLAGPTSFAYQVERMKFDQILLENSRRKGVDVRENHTVLEVVETGGRVTGVKFRDADGALRQANARYVVDGSGNLSGIHRAAGGNREYSEFFQNVAVYGYFAGGGRLPAPNSGNIYCAAFDEGWFWYIPLRDDLTSVGAVVSKEFAANVQGDPEQALSRFIDRCPDIAALLADTPKVAQGPYSKVRVRKDYSYRNTEFWRPGMVLVGDAACFVDPVFSSGVHLATYSSLLAARSINSALAGEVTEEQAFAEFERRYRREYAIFYEFLVSFYDLHIDEGSYFWKAKKIINAPDTELESFATLVAGVASGESALTTGEQADAVRARIEAAAIELDGASGNGTDGGALFRSKVVADVMREGSQVQAEAMFGGDLHGGFGDSLSGDAEGDVLATSADGLGWVIAKQ